MNVRRSHVICHFHHEFDPVFESLIIKPVSVPQIVYSSHCKFYSLLIKPTYYSNNLSLYYVIFFNCNFHVQVLQ